MAKKSVVISFRLHPSSDEEAKAIEIVKRLQNEGWTNRQIFTSALLEADGYKPEMFRDSKVVTQSAMVRILEEFAGDIIQELKGVSYQDSNSVSNKKSSPFGDDEDENVAHNLAKGFMSRRKGK